MRQALAGMLWSKQYDSLDADRCLKERGAHALRPGHRRSRNTEWFHMVDVDSAKQQPTSMLHPLYLHPSGQIPGPSAM